MQLIQCVNAYMAAVALSEKEMDYKTSYALTRLKKKLRPHVDFFSAEERKLVEEYAARDEDGNIIWIQPGKCKLQDPMWAEEYARRMEELGSVDVQEEFTPWRASAPKSIKPIHLEALEGFILFGDEGE